MRTLGIDLGTSGVRAIILQGPDTAASHAVAIPPEQRRNPAVLWASVEKALQALDLAGVQAVAVDGTSGTLLAVAADGAALGPLSLYNEAAPDDVVAAIKRAAPDGSAAHGRTSALGRAVGLQATPDVHRILHEADWVAGRLCRRFDTTDTNNALKTGYDPVAQQWPAWIAEAGMDAALLPRVLPPGTALAGAIRRFGLPGDAVVAAGTTDGCASFLSTGAEAPGDAVTALGSTLTLKLLSGAPVSAPAHGIYSHRLGDRWLAGGASNTGGAVLAAYFSPAQLDALSARIDPLQASGLDYYPLLHPGERFPVNDPAWPPRLLPRPADDAAFLHGLLEGIAQIEALGYRLLMQHGAPAVTRVLTVGGGAANLAWTAIRARILGVPVLRAATSSAAHGAAILARAALA